ncbi:3-deoxy-D-manno-octulosonic acid transferase [Desulfurivibrio dismutans]|uniref:3-deoxy-D-manno-octulosonic acid transferase n=1 Tax=Desulfurivibrio dismutans TaxID=1398908 RepID=UPI0023DCD16B|nr:glycosyltransferase N-terminal domain-containing protein [Desulfurivibrio alkaliphilus]MDF1615559.1 glycosyltransferase N-terminal domain-containing protein [Desulfurivibrio alkaliphilus]
MANFIYQIIAWACFLVISPLFVIYSLGGKAYEWRQRLGFHPRTPLPPLKKQRLWLHAASVGEVQVARALIPAIERQIPEAEIWVSTLTRHGHQLSCETMPSGVVSIFAPLDLFGVCHQAMGRIAPDLYVGLETELWPEIIRQAELHRAGPLLLNARLSEKSYRRYRTWPVAPLIGRTIGRFRAISAIGDDDAQRFRKLGAVPESIRVSGNAKYDLRPTAPGPADKLELEARQQTEQLRSRLGLHPEQPVLVAGSTHTGEEELLLAAWQRLKRNLPGLVLIIAPRHLRRLPEIENFFQQRALIYWRYSDRLKASENDEATAGRRPAQNADIQSKRSLVLLVDRMGELAALYGVADYVFCGGSLVRKGGHNLLEAASLGKPVLFGPYMEDFREDAELLINGGGGFMVRDDEGICQRIMAFHTRPAEYHRAADKARDIAHTLRGAARQQAELIKKQLYSENSSCRRR